MNRELIEQFRTLQNFYKQEKDIGRSIAYRKAITALQTIGEPIISLEQVENVRGIGPKVKDKIREFLKNKSVKVAEEKKEIMKNQKIEVMTDKDLALEEFKTIWGIGPKKAEVLYNSGIHTLKKLREKQNEYLTKQQMIGLKYQKQLKEKIPKDSITVILVMMILKLNQRYGENSYKIEIAGSYRRKASKSGDIDCLITSNKFTLKDVVEFFQECKIITDVLSMRNEKFMGIAKTCDGNGKKIFVRLDIEFVKKSEWGSALLYFTGSKDFNVYMRAEAKRQGFRLNEHGLFRGTEKILRNPSEKDIFEKLNIRYTLPENR